MSRISTAVRFPGASGAQLAARLDLPGRAGAARLRAVRALLHVLEGHQGDDAHRGGARRRRPRHAALRLHRARRLGRRIREHRFLVERRRPGRGRALARNRAPRAVAARRAQPRRRGGARGGCADSLGAPRSPPSTRRRIPRISASSSQDARTRFAARARRKSISPAAASPIRREFLDDIAVQNIAQAVAELKRALLVMHAPADTIVSDRSRVGDLSRRQASEELRLARHRRSPADAARGRALRGHRAGGVGEPLPARGAGDGSRSRPVRATPCS